MTRGAARIAIAEHWNVLRRGLAALLHGSYTVVADVEDVAALRQLAEQRPLDLVVVGDSPPVEIVRDTTLLCDAAPDLPVVLLCDDIDATRLRAVLQVGARAVFSKKADDATILDGVERVLAGDRVVDQRFLPLLYGGDEQELAPTAAEDSLLTPRELDVLGELARGSTNKQIAETLLVGESTVKTHLARIYTKLEVDDRHHAVGRALELGLLG